MSFVPLTGPAVFTPALPPKDGVIEFTGSGRSIPLPIRAALPILTRAFTRDDLHPSVALLSAAARLAMRLSGAEQVARDPSNSFWVGVVEGADADRVRLLAEARAYEGVPPRMAEQIVRDIIDGVVDAVARSAPPARPRMIWTAPPEEAEPIELVEDDAAARIARRLAAHVPAPVIPEGAAGGVLSGALGGVLGAGADGLPVAVGVAFRVEADEGDLVSGSVRLVAQVHDESDPLHIVDAERLWSASPEDIGFGEGARSNVLVQLQVAANAWSPVGRLLDPAESGVPDQITLDAAEIADLLEHGVGALKSAGFDVLWPRTLGSDLTARAVLDRKPSKRDAEPYEDRLYDGLFAPDAMFAFNWQLALGDEPLTDEEMDELAAAASPVLKLRGSWMVVHPDIARKARKRLLREVSASEALATALTGMADLDELEDVPIIGASLLRLRDQVMGALDAPAVDVPGDLKATLRDYQRQGLTWLATVTGLGLGCCLADDMGLGKTVTLIALHLHRIATGHRGPTLVVCPTSLMGNWEAEIGKFAPHVPVRRFHGSARDLDAALGEDELGGFVLTTYGTMRRDAETLAQVGWGLVVADEAQHVKNASSDTAKALRSIGSGQRVALTGTPVENDLTELWAILDWCVPGLLGSRQAFRRVWASAIESGAHIGRAREFSELISPFLLRRRKSDPGIAPELPPKIETNHLLALTKEQAVLYEAYVRETMEQIERATLPDGRQSDNVMRRGLILQLLTGLKQICNHPAHFLKQASGKIAGRSEKIELLDELIDTVRSEDGATLVFTQFVAMGHLLESHWQATGVPYQFLYGETPVKKREQMVEAFQAGEVPVFMLSLQAGGTGLNLTRADHVIHVDRWWNPAVEDQATDRAYRIGQTKPVQVHRLITRGTIEEKIDELLTRKRALAESVLGRGEAALTELSNDELRDLVSLRA